MRLVTLIAVVAAIAAGSAAILYFFPIVMTQADKLAVEIKNSSIIGTSSNDYQQVQVTVNGVKLVADIAANEAQRTKGLAVKDRLNDNESMLFVFPSASNQAFWMKDMKFPIDIIWMDVNKTVVHIEHSLEPCPAIGYCRTYTPGADSLYVLETVAGFADKYNITNGTRMEFNLE